jgi:hypothetical protein
MQTVAIIKVTEVLRYRIRKAVAFDSMDYRSHGPKALTDKDAVVLGLISDQRIAQTLMLMNQPKEARLTPELAQDVCQRTGSAATLEGSISRLGPTVCFEPEGG